MSGVVQLMLALAVLASFALIGVGGWALARRRGSAVKAGLMIGAGVVTLLNAWLYALPAPGAG